MLRWQYLCSMSESSFGGAKEEVAAFRDLCIHRGTALSLGWIQDENLVCPYHGWTYAPDGTCVRIPSLPAGHAIPAKARATAVFKAHERYGLVWVCLADPRAPIPEIAELEDPNYHTFFHSAEVWETSAARMIENFIDTSHFPYVHPDINATRDDPVIPDFEVKQNGLELASRRSLPLPPAELFGGQTHYPPTVHLPRGGANTELSYHSWRRLFVRWPKAGGSWYPLSPRLFRQSECVTTPFPRATLR